MQVCPETEIFDHLCDAAVLEEARHRLGDAAIQQVLGVTEDTIYSWRRRYKTHRFTPEERKGLIDALNKTLAEQPKDPLREILERLARIEVAQARLATLRAANKTDLQLKEDE